MPFAIHHVCSLLYRRWVIMLKTGSVSTESYIACAFRSSFFGHADSAWLKKGYFDIARPQAEILISDVASPSFTIYQFDSVNGWDKDVRVWSFLTCKRLRCYLVKIKSILDLTRFVNGRHFVWCVNVSWLEDIFTPSKMIWEWNTESPNLWRRLGPAFK